MAMIACPECGRQVSDRAVSCPDCGCPISAAPAVPQRDPAEELGKLITLARRAREGSDGKNAKKYYEQILEKDPGNWEAIFYTVYYEASECKLMNVASAANSVANSVYSTFAAIADLKDEKEQDEAVETVITSACAISLMFVNAAVNHYNQFSTTDNAFSECSNRVVAAGNIYGEIEASFKKALPEKKDRLAKFQRLYLVFLESNSRWYNNTYLSNAQTRLKNEIGAVDPTYAFECKIADKNREINAVVTERKAAAGCLAYLLFPLGAGLSVFGISTDEMWIYLGIFLLVLGGLCLIKTPSEAVIAENKEKKQRLIEERDALQRQLDELRKG